MTPRDQTVNLGHKGNADEVGEDLQLTGAESSACALRRASAVIGSVCRQVWIVIQYSLKMTAKLHAKLFVPITQRMYNVQFVLVKIPVTVQGVPNTPVRSPRTAVDGHRHSDKVLGCAN